MVIPSQLCDTCIKDATSFFDKNNRQIKGVTVKKEKKKYSQKALSNLLA